MFSIRLTPLLFSIIPPSLLFPISPLFFFSLLSPTILPPLIPSHLFSFATSLHLSFHHPASISPFISPPLLPPSQLHLSFFTSTIVPIKPAHHPFIIPFSTIIPPSLASSSSSTVIFISLFHQHLSISLSYSSLCLHHHPSTSLFLPVFSDAFLLTPPPPGHLPPLLPLLPHPRFPLEM